MCDVVKEKQNVKYIGITLFGDYSGSIPSIPVHFRQTDGLGPVFLTRGSQSTTQDTSIEPDVEHFTTGPPPKVDQNSEASWVTDLKNYIILDMYLVALNIC